MVHERLTWLSVLAVAIGSLVLTSAPLSGQSETARTPWGDPDLQGVWANNSATPLQRLEAFGDKATLSDEELASLKAKAAEVVDGGDAFFGDDLIRAALADGTDFRSFDENTGNYDQSWLVEREFENRTSLIVDPPDGRLPEMTPEGKKRSAKATRGFLGIEPEGPEDLSNQVRCISWAAPNMLAGYNSYFQILQTPDHVVILQELAHEVRIIPMGGRPHLDDTVRLWLGDSRGHWENDTLVVETTNYSPKSYFKGTAENLHLIERFTRVDAETITWEITVTDPTTYASPWTAMVPLKSSSDAIYEFACHEGNHGLVGVLKSARFEEKAAKKASH